MEHFHYQHGELFAENIAVRSLVEQYGSPLYVYSAQAFKDNFQAIKQAFEGISPLICFSVKSCCNLSVLKLMVEQGAGLDVVSGGELYRALQAGVAPEKIVFAGVGKSRVDIRAAIDAGVFLFNAESEAELQRIDEIALAAGKRIKAAIRVNPDVEDEDTPEKTATGGRQTKFGIPLERAYPLFAAQRYRQIDVVGLHAHIGSPIPSAQSYLNAIEKLEQMVDKLAEQGSPIEFINLGGGYPATYGTESKAATPLPEMGRAICARLAGLRARGIRFLIEPGRSISANAGILLTTVEFMKQGWDHKIAIVDAGMNVLIRPTLYDAKHVVWPAQFGQFNGSWQALPHRDVEAGFEKVDVVGPICETGDYFALGRHLPILAADEVLAIFSCGAYGMSMASQYNSHGRPAEVLVEGSTSRVIRQREDHADLVAHEIAALSVA